MIIIPKKDPVIRDLNSYYLHIERLIEHYRGELTAGAIHFLASNAEGMLFFDETDLLGGVLEEKGERISGRQAVDPIIETLRNNNFNVSVYQIGPDIIHFWTRLSDATPLYSDLSAEFTDLERLIAKMREEKLTGFIDVSLADENHGGIICFNDGNVIDCTCSWQTDGETEPDSDPQRLILEKARKGPGGVFNVNRISLDPESPPPPPETSADTAPATQSGMPEGGEPSLEMVRDLLLIFEKTVKTHKKRRAADFGKLLRKKFVEKADRYDFLDPFTAEFEYAEGTLRYDGSEEIIHVAQGVVESIKELADELGLLYEFLTNTEPWREKYAGVIERSDIRI